MARFWVWRMRWDGTHKPGLLVEAGLHKLLQRLAVVALQGGWVVLWDEEEHLHGVELRMRGLAFGQLDGRDAQGPDVGLRETQGLCPRSLTHSRLPTRYIVNSI